MSLLELEEVRAANIGSGLSDDALQDAIDEEEAWLARRIGPLAGERTERFPLAGLAPTGTQVHLRRPTDEVEVQQDGAVITTVEMRGNGWVVALLPDGTRWTGVLEVEYEPNDELEVRRALKQLLQLTVTALEAGGKSSEQMGSYSYQLGAGTTARARQSILRSLRAPASAGSTRLLSSVRHGTAGVLER